MNSDNEHESKNIDCALEMPEEKSSTDPAGEESVVSDLLFALGFKKKAGGKKKLASDSQLQADIPEAIEGSTDSRDDLPPDDPEGTVDGADSFETEIVGTDTTERMRKKSKTKKLVLTVLAILILTVCLIRILPYLLEPTPPGEDVVASYNGKNITIEEFKSFIALEQAKESEHAYCETHGYDHTQCDSAEPCESHPVDSIEGYRQMAVNLAVEQIIQEWASSQGVTQREDVQHGIKDLLEDANVSQLIDQLHEEKITPESISSWEIQQYYDDNKDTFGGKSLAEVEDEIRQILVSKKDEDFFPKYLEELKKTAGLQVNFDLLKVTEPTEEEISAYYKQNTSKYKASEKAEALEIKITGGDAQSTAAEAIRKIRSGESFDSVAAAYSQDGKVSKLSLEKGSGEAAVEAVIWKMQLGDISEPVANADGSVSIIKLVSTAKAGTQPLSEVKSDIRLILLQQNMEREYKTRKNEALFSVHSRRYTLGDFYTEFKELSPEYQAQFSTLDQKQQLVEQLIAKELLLEETGDGSSDKSQKHGYDELKIQYLAQILHQQKVDDKLKDPTKDEMKKFYNENKKSFVAPASVQISLIWIDQGPEGEKAEQARKKADEALSLLNQGADFAEVAKKYSEDSSADSGGEINGIYYQDQFPDELGTAVFALQSGKTSGIIDYNYGYYIIKVRERTEERQMTYKESAESIKEHLSEEKHSKLESEMEQTLLKNADFTVYDKTLRKLIKEQNKQQAVL